MNGSARPNFMITPYVDSSKIKLCTSCKHFDSPGSKCTRFGRLNLVNGSVSYMDALTSREYTSFCGNDGKFHEYKDVNSDKPNEPL